VDTFQKLKKLWARHSFENPDKVAEGFVLSPKQLDDPTVTGWLDTMAQDFDGIGRRTVEQLRTTLDSYYPKDKIKQERTTHVSDDWTVPRESGEIPIRVYTPKQGQGPFPVLL